MHQAYLLRFKSHPGPKNHQQLIVGTVQKRTNPADGALDFVATSSELIKPLPQSIPTNWKAQALQKCKELHGAKCKHRGIKEVYECKAALKKWPKGKFVFEGGADPEFAVPSKFVEAGEFFVEERAWCCTCVRGFVTDACAGKAILEKNTKYDVVFNNCKCCYPCGAGYMWLCYWFGADLEAGRSHALAVKNVAKLKKGQDPLVDIELETLNIDDSG